MKIQELLTDKNKWCQGTSAEDKKGNPVTYYSPHAVRWCLSGAMKVCYPDAFTDKVGFAILAHLKPDSALFETHYAITEWNDAPERTFEDIRTLVQELDL